MKLCSFNLAFCLLIAGSLPLSAQDLQIAPAPKIAPAPRTALFTPRSPVVVQIRFHVLEMPDTQKAQSELKAFFPNMRADRAEDLRLFRLGNDVNDRVDSLIHHLKEQQLARKISQPTITVVSGNRGEFPLKKIGASNEAPDTPTMMIGCLPKASDHSSQLQLEITGRFARKPSVAGDPDDSANWSCKLQVTSDELIALRHKTNPNLLIFAKASKITGFLAVDPNQMQPLRQVSHTTVGSEPKTDDNLPAENVQGPITEVVQLMDVLQSVAGNTVIAVELEGDNFEIETILDSGRDLKELAKAMSTVKNAKLDLVRINMLGHGAKVSLIGRMSNSAADENAQSGQIRMLSKKIESLHQEVIQLRETLQE